MWYRTVPTDKSVVGSILTSAGKSKNKQHHQVPYRDGSHTDNFGEKSPEILSAVESQSWVSGTLHVTNGPLLSLLMHTCFAKNWQIGYLRTFSVVDPDPDPVVSVSFCRIRIQSLPIRLV